MKSLRKITHIACAVNCIKWRLVVSVDDFESGLIDSQRLKILLRDSGVLVVDNLEMTLYITIVNLFFDAATVVIFKYFFYCSTY